MSDFYTKMASTASRLISKYGQSVLLIRSGDTAHPVSGATTSGGGVNLKVSGTLQKYPDNLIDGTRIKASDRLMIIDGSKEPLASDLVKIDNQNWAIESIKTVNPAGTALIYFIQVRR